jgi:signal transduction histidine kinase
VTARVFHYTGAIAAVIVASLATSGLESLLGPSVSLLFFPAVVIPAVYGGYGPALVATILSTLSLAYFFVAPKGSLQLGADDILRLAVFVGIAFATAWLSSARRRAEEAEHASLLLLAERNRELAVREDRLRVSRDLHDGVLQALTGIRLGLQDMASDCAGHPVHDRLLGTERALAIEQRELRRLIDSLQPDAAMADTAGALLAALRDMTSRLAVEWKTPISVRVRPSDLTVPDALEHSVRLMLHEAIVNALQHAQPSRVAVTVDTAHGELRMSVVDDGRGFPFHGRMEHDALIQEGLGPATLRDRVASLHGRMSIDSGIRGSRIDLAVPFTVS